MTISQNNLTSVRVKLTSKRKKDKSTGNFYSFMVLTSADYKPATWNKEDRCYNNDGAGILFTATHDFIKSLDFTKNAYFARYSKDEIINDGLCNNFDIISRNLATGELKVVYVHHSASAKDLDAITNFKASNIL